MIAVQPRVALGVAALAAALALAVALSLRGADGASGPDSPRLLVPLFALEALSAEPVPAPADSGPPPAPVSPPLPGDPAPCFVATERCAGIPCMQFVEAARAPGQIVTPCDPFPRARPHFHRVFVASP